MCAMNNLTGIHDLLQAIEKIQSARAEGGGRSFDTAVVLHLYYPDLWGEISGYLANLGSNFDLYVSVCDTAKESDVENIKRHYPEAFICKMENRGRDVGPFMEIYPALVGQYKYICKVHSKKSQHRLGGDGWRQVIYDELLGSPKRVADIKALFDCFPNVGIAGPEGQIYLCRNHLGINAEKITELAKLMGVNEAGNFDYDFATGSMFWFKPGALVPMLNLNIKQASFESEQGQVDGTLAHALERIFPLAAKVAGFDMVGTNMLEALKEYFGEKWYHDQFGLDVNQDSSALFIKLTKCIKALAERDREIKSLRNSSSWRLTAPIRHIKRMSSEIIKKTI